MGLRGPEKEYDVSMRLTVSHSQDELLQAMASLQDVSKQEVMRRMIDSFFPYSLAHYGTKEETDA